MKIKAKLTLGVGLFFMMILLLAVLGAFYVRQLASETQYILADNYSTLDYTRQMMDALDDDFTRLNTLQRFETNLFRQEHNETEPGERELTEKLAADFAKLKHDPQQQALRIAVRKDLTGIMLLNMQAINRKSETAAETARVATRRLVIAGSLCFLVAFTLLVNLPGNIANPIRVLTENIKQVAAKNYTSRVNFEEHNEFGELAAAFNSMAGKLEEYESSNLARLLREKQRIDTLVNNMQDPVIGLDEKRYVLFANNEALHISGLQAAQLIGQQIDALAQKNDLLRRWLENDGKNPRHVITAFANGKESFFENEVIPITVKPAGEKQEKHIGDVILLRNITPFRELDVAKTNFIATVSHELKTPIAAIKMSLQLIDDARTGTLNGTQQQLVESMKDDSERLLKITGELLKLSQVETGNIQLSIQRCEPAHIVQYALETVRTQAAQAGVTITSGIGPAGVAVKADLEKTAWVLTNLLTNAIRYSQSGGEVVIATTAYKQMLEFSVSDHGKGIEPRYVGRIFERYFQVPGSGVAGTGLGLAISKEFIEAQGGHIGVESEPGTGSRFFFRLPQSAG